MAFDILFVCWANVCRSPLAETVARQRLREHHVTDVEIAVASAGVRAEVGWERCEVSARWLSSNARDVPVHCSRPVTVETARSANLVVAMDRETTGQLLTVSPGLGPRTFTLREATHLAAAVEQLRLRDDRPGRSLGEDSLQWLVRAMDSARGLLPLAHSAGVRPRWPAQPGPFDVPDAHRTSATRPHRRVLPMVTSETQRLVDILLDLL